jgi:hypothetical protein
MKIAVTFEKKDILRLIEKELKAQGLKVKKDTVLEYKGALEVKLSVETEDDTPFVAKPAMPVSGEQSSVPQETGPTVAGEDDDHDMSGVLDASTRLVKHGTGLKRTLKPNETTEFPR